MNRGLIVITLVFISNITYGQSNNLRLNVGVGFPDLINLGFGYKISEKSLMQLNYGFFPTESSSNFSLEHNFFISNSRKLNDFKTWYFGQRLLYHVASDDSGEYKHLLVGLVFGRQFNVNEKLGITFDLGMMYFLVDKATYFKLPRPERNIPFLPSSKLILFYRF